MFIYFLSLFCLLRKNIYRNKSYLFIFSIHSYVSILLNTYFNYNIHVFLVSSTQKKKNYKMLNTFGMTIFSHFYNGKQYLDRKVPGYWELSVFYCTTIFVAAIFFSYLKLLNSNIYLKNSLQSMTAKYV